MTTLLPVFESLLHEFPGLAYRCLNDASWTMQYVSSGAKDLTGYAPQNFIGNSAIAYVDIVHVDDRQRLQCEIDSALAAFSSFTVEYRIVTANGAIRFVCERGNAIRNENGHILALQGFVTDVTTAREMRRALDEVTERFRWIAQATNDNMWDWNLRTNEIWHGLDTRNIFSLPSNETRSEITCWSALVHPNDREWVLVSIEKAIKGTAREWSAEYRLQRRDGSYAEVLDRAFIVRDSNDVPVRMVGGVSDVSENKRSKHHLGQLSRAVRVLSQCSQRLVRAADEGSLLGDICEVIVETGGHQAVLVSLVDQVSDGALNLTSGYCPRLRRIVFDDLTSGSHRRDLALASMAMNGTGAVVCNDLSKDGIAPTSQEELLGRGHRSAICLALTHDSQTLGVISVYSGAVATFDAEEIQLLETLANNIAFGLANLRSRDDRNRIETAAVKIAAGVSASTGVTFFEQFARNMALAVGADAAFVAQFDDGKLERARTVTAVIDNVVVPNFEYFVLGAPCEALLASNKCIAINDVASCFPASEAARIGMYGYVGCRLDDADGRPLGMLFVLFREPVSHPAFVGQTIEIFAARAGAELARQVADARIIEQASLLDEAKDAIVVHNASHHVTFWNKSAERMYGLPAHKVLGRPINAIVYDDVDDFEAMCTSLTTSNEWQGEVTRQRADGTKIALAINSTLMRDGTAKPGSVLSIITDISRRKSAEHEVSKLAFYDQLTGLPNRHFLEKKLHQSLEDGATGGSQGALLWIDLDRLKNLNDTRGHDVGDALLRRTAERILTSIDDGNIAARFGGDEFVVLITDLEDTPERVVCVAHRLLDSLSKPLDLDGYSHCGSASIGLTYFSCGHDVAAEILKRADIAMYEAKGAGRNTLRLFDQQMQESVEVRAELETDLRQALEDNALHLAYQPQVSDTGEVTGVEALLRWNHPVRGPVSPAEFIPVAETSGLILACGAWVLNEACIQLKRWETNVTARSLTIAVNVSAKELLHPGFVGQVMNVLQRTGADPAKLKLELTESSLVTDTDATVEKMKTLKAVGISFSLDDFGTGFSSLSYLKRLPLDQLKIDRSFVLDVVTDLNAAVITRSIIALGQSLSLEVIAEGVETDPQRRFLAIHGCKIYQGFLFSRPIVINELENYLLQSSNGGNDCLLPSEG
jgi:diguanylate cyclase (GGDEF)-like protein/PAS domain S-box-containing protein